MINTQNMAAVTNQVWASEKISKINKLLISPKRKQTKLNINDEKAYLATDMIIRELYVILFYQIENLNETDYFLRKYKLQSLTQEQLENLNISRLLKKLKTIVKT